MNANALFLTPSILVDEDIHFSLIELSRACRSDAEELIPLVNEGVLPATGDKPQSWVFAGSTLKRARCALRIARDLELGPAGTALVLDLLDEMEALRSRLRQVGAL